MQQPPAPDRRVGSSGCHKANGVVSPNPSESLAANQAAKASSGDCAGSGLGIPQETLPCSSRAGQSSVRPPAVQQAVAFRAVPACAVGLTSCTNGRRAKGACAQYHGSDAPCCGEVAPDNNDDGSSSPRCGEGNRKLAEAQRSDVTANTVLDYTAPQPDSSNHQATTEPDSESSATPPIPRSPTPDGRAHQDEHSAEPPRQPAADPPDGKRVLERQAFSKLCLAHRPARRSDRSRVGR